MLQRQRPDFTRRHALAIMGSAGTMTLAGCNALFPARYRFRMTVEVDTPEGLRTGSSVMEVSSSLAAWRIGESHALDTTFRGEAVAVDVFPGQTLFALIVDLGPGRGLAGVVTLLFEPDYTGPESFVASVRKLGGDDQLGRTVTLSRASYPKLVRFRDIRNPKSVELIDADDLARGFSLGVRLRRIYVTIVDDAITDQIDRRLPWLPNHLNLTFAGNRYRVDNSLPDTLAAGSFSTELR